MLRKKIGQMLVMGFDGFTIHENSAIQRWIEEENIGGVLLFDYDLTKQRFGKNLKNIEQIKSLNQTLKNLSSDIPLFIALDYEGGAVDRLKQIAQIPGTIEAASLAKLPIEQQNQEIQKMASTLKGLGFNLNFAPVVDLNITDKEGIIGKLGRSFSKCPEIIADYAKRFTQIFNQHGLYCCFKHFPGHGSATKDSHLGFVDVSETFEPQELLPYQMLFQDPSLKAMVMTAHVINQQLDPRPIPATLSKPILTDLLRNKLGFDGLIISDDLQMQAIANHFTLEDALKMTINAGADMVIFGNQLGTISASTVIDIIERLVKAEEIPMSLIDKAYDRILQCKKAIF